ncbi:hypothetical protein HAX54_041511, partial [Datura stramonium]|nr:hypothetical protein [Datura stramonium]
MSSSRHLSPNIRGGQNHLSSTLEAESHYHRITQRAMSCKAFSASRCISRSEYNPAKLLQSQ